MPPGTALACLCHAVRTADWLTAARARAWCRVLAVVSAAGVVVYIATSSGGLDAFGRPLGTDFVSFWCAGRLALGGNPAAAYDPALHAAAQHALFPQARAEYYAFFYPPPFLLLCLPFAAMPYALALVAWLACGVVPFWWCLRRLLAQRWALLPCLAAPGVLVTAGHGQTALLTAAGMGWSLVLARRRPFVAGLCLGMLIIKPHLLAAAPVALLAARRWRMAAGALASCLGACLLSWLLLGGAAWAAYLRVLPLARATLERGFVPPWKMASAFAAVRLLAGGIDLAYCVQAALAIAACLVLARTAWRRPGEAAEGAMSAAATLLCSPFLLDYDEACLAVPSAFLAAEAVRTEWRDGEKILLLAAYVLPLAARPMALASGIGLGPAVTVGLLLVLSRRAESGLSRPLC